MYSVPRFLLAAFLLISQIGEAQKLKKADKAVISNLQAHIGYLADDKLEGRRAGSKGEELAMTYISQQFQQIGLQPKGENNGFYQSFNIYDGKEYNKSFLIINSNHIDSSKFFPLPMSPKASIEALPSIALRESGVPWFLNLAEELQSNSKNPHYDIQDFLLQKSKEYAKKGATCLIVYNTSAIDDKLVFDGKQKGEPLAIPVIYVAKDVAKKYFSDETAALDLKLKVEFTDKNRIGHNVAGYIDNAASNTVILGAHFDHLGYGEDGNSMFRGTEKLIHNGADDNASGTAALIELARILKSSKIKKYNYLFVAFSGEELGLFGSKYYTEHPTIDLSRANFMINMDMIGRLNDSSKTVTVSGFGTSPSWSSILTEAGNAKYFTAKFDSSGTGPSDHTSFYRKDIPVLFFFTGLHSDYHRPSDDADKINYTGEYYIVRYISNVIAASSKQDKLVFTKTREQQSSTSARFSVSMGIMPDYTYNGAGVRVDGVSEGRAAQKAGLKTGDIVLQLGDNNIASLEMYMQALGKYKKGDKTTVKVKRASEEKVFDITF